MNFVSKDLASLKDVYRKMLYILNGRQRRISALVLVMTIVGALLETLGVSIVLPLIQAFLTPEQLLQNKYVKPVAEAIYITTGTQLIIWLSIAVIAIYIFKNAYMVLLSFVRVKFATMVKRELSVKMMRSYMYREYTYFLGVNTEDVLRGIGYDVTGVYEVLVQTFKILAETLTAFCICVFIFRTDPAMAVGVVTVAGISLAFLILFFRKKMKKVGDFYRKCTVEVNKYLHESFQGIKDVLIFQREDFFVKNYERVFGNQQRAEVIRTVSSESPSYLIEAVCVSGLVAIVAGMIAKGGAAADFIAQLGVFAMAAFRILPSIGKISACFNQLTYSFPALNATYRNLQEVEKYRKVTRVKQFIGAGSGLKLNFHDEIHLKNICWQYPGADKPVIENLSLRIPKGQAVALIGQSGAGKSTLADIMLGLLVPEQGDILVDGISIYDEMNVWKKTLGYVPQTVFLIDDTIRRNIAFGVQNEEIDEGRVQRAVEQAQLRSTIAELPHGLDTVLGERGIRFSGGQRQRVAIARALYNDPDILILDEATAALDNDTENAVMEAIDALQGYKTLIIIAHRLTTIRNCDVIYEIRDGKALRREKAEIFS